MNYLGPREILDPVTDLPTGKYRYTRRNNGRVWAIGHCSPTVACPACNGRALWNTEEPWCPRCEHKGFIEVACPCPGHDTPEGACAHYKEYLLDHAKFQGPKQERWPKHKCAVAGCESEATHLATVDSYRMYELCAAHANREALVGLVHVGESIES